MLTFKIIFKGRDDKNLGTFAFLIGKLMVCESKPSLLEVLHTKPLPTLCPLDHEPIAKKDHSSITEEQLAVSNVMCARRQVKAEDYATMKLHLDKEPR